MFYSRQTPRLSTNPKLQEVKQTLKARMHAPLRVVGEWLGRVLRGYYQYHAVPGNFEALTLLRERVSRYWWHVLRRRSQTGRLGADRMHRLAHSWLPTPRLLHPYPDLRFDARFQVRRRMRE